MLSQAIVQTLQSVIHDAVQQVKATGLPLYEVRAVEALLFAEDGSIRGAEHQQQRDVGQTTRAIIDVAATSDSLEALIESVASDPRLRELFLVDASGAATDPQHWGTDLRNNLLAPVSGWFVAELADLDWDEAAFGKALERLNAWVARPVTSVIETTPLDNFVMTVDRLDLWPDVWIDRLGDDERQGYFQSGVRFAGWGSPMIEWHVISTWRFAIRRHFEVQGRSVLQIPSQEMPDNVITGLRLMQDGAIGSQVRWWRTEPWTESFDSMRMTLRRPAYGPTFTLKVEPSTAARIVALVESLRRPRSDSDLEVALRRFGFAYERLLDEDRLVDYWIGLEALFAKKDERTEITERLSMRIARLLGSSLTDRRSRRKKAKDLYSLRSKVVHGNVSPPNLTTATTETGEMLRDAIRRRLQPESWTIDELEDSMLQ